MAISKTFVAHSQLNASDLNELKDQANAYIAETKSAVEAEIASATSGIERQSTQSEEDKIRFETDAGTTVGTIGPNGADFANLKRGGNQVATTNQLVTKDTSIGDNPSNSHVPTTKAVKEYVDANAMGDLPITEESTQSEDEEVAFGNDAENDTYARVGFYGVKAKAYKKLNGDDAIPPLDTSIGDNPSNSHTPSTQAVKKYVDNHSGIGNLPISNESTATEDEEAVWGNDAGTQTYVKIGDYGIKAKAYFDLKGNPLNNGGNITNITVKKDGSGDFTNVVAAVKSITNSPTSKDVYNIYIYEGIYDMVADYYTAENADYHDSSLPGLKLPHNVNLIGVGSRNAVILKGELPSDAKLRTSIAFSPINLRGYDNRLQNLTITNFNGRYPVHDQASQNNDNDVYRHEYINCVLIHKGFDSGASTATVVTEDNNDTSHRWGSTIPLGQGTINEAHTYCQYCSFVNESTVGDAFLSHDANESYKGGSHIIFDSCSFSSLHSDIIVYLSCLGQHYDNTIEFRNCKNNVNNGRIIGRISSSGSSTDFTWLLLGKQPANSLIDIPQGYDDNNMLV